MTLIDCEYNQNEICTPFLMEKNNGSLFFFRNDECSYKNDCTSLLTEDDIWKVYDVCGSNCSVINGDYHCVDEGRARYV